MARMLLTLVGMPGKLPCAALAALLLACAPAEEVPASEGAAEGGKADTVFRNGPLYLTGAFDGSKKFQMWIDTMEFARSIQADFGKALKFTYFINTCYFDPSVRGSAIGVVGSAREATARFALAQQAINEGHEIGNHAVRHKDGSDWSLDQWRIELGEFHAVTDTNLFKPILDASGQHVFPKWRAMPNSEIGETGASCGRNSDCDSGICAPISETQSFCTATCNKHNPCENDTVCGAPDWHTSVDYCMPMPEFPIVHQGLELFDASGRPNLSHPALEAYPIVGFRAPQLGHNKAMFEVLDELGYSYDTSKVLSPGPPSRVVHGGTVFDEIYEYALMKNPGSRTIPMDYNYKANDTGGDRMLADYQKSVLDAYNKRGRQPWNIGHHFALWRGGAYWRAMQDTFTYAAKGCPTANGELGCANVEFPSFVQLTEHLDAKTDGLDDIFVDANAEHREVVLEHPPMCECDEAH